MTARTAKLAAAKSKSQPDSDLSCLSGSEDETAGESRSNTTSKHATELGEPSDSSESEYESEMDDVVSERSDESSGDEYGVFSKKKEAKVTRKPENASTFKETIDWTGLSIYCPGIYLLIDFSLQLTIHSHC